jgi:hypothetical protein
LLANIGKSKLLSSIDHHNGDFNCMIWIFNILFSVFL